MRWNGVGKLVEVQGKMNAEQYCEILEDGMEESFEKLEMEEEEHVRTSGSYTNFHSQQSSSSLSFSTVIANW